MFTDYTSILSMNSVGMQNYASMDISAELANVNDMSQLLGAGAGSSEFDAYSVTQYNSQTSNYNNYVDYLNGNTGTSSASNLPGNAAAAAGAASGNASFDPSNLVANYLKTYFPGMSNEQIAGVNAYYDKFYGQMESAFADYAGSLGQTGAAAATSASSSSSKSSKVSSLVKDLKSMVGLNENKKADRKEINKITGKSGVDCKTTPWCAAFAMNMLKKHGLLNTKSCANVNSCPTVQKWAKKQGIWKSHSSGYTPKPGDAIMFDYNKNGKAQHIGIVVKVENGKVYTIEGNSSDSVKKRSYSLSAGKILGYIACGEQKK